MMRGNHLRARAIVLVLSLALTGALSGRAYGEKSVTASYTATSGAFLALWVAKGSGSFEKYGVNVSLAYVAGGPKAVAALLSGSAPISLSSGSSLVHARLRGAGVIGIAKHTYTFVASLMVAPQIRTAAQLKGKTLGISRFGGTTDLGTRIALKHLGLRPNTDVAIRQMGGVRDVFLAMKRGYIQGGYLPAPLNLAVEKEGFNTLVDLGSLKIPYDQSLLLASVKLIRRDRPLVLDFLKGYVAGIARAKHDKPFAEKVLARYTRVKDPEILNYSYRMFIQKYLEEVPMPTTDSIETVLNFIKPREPKAATANPADFIDPSLIRQLKDSGFIRSLY